jgi:hypothetical protein
VMEQMDRKWFLMSAMRSDGEKWKSDTLRWREVNTAYTVVLDTVANLRSVQSTHKVLTNVEYRPVSGVFQNSDPPPPCFLPPHQRRGGGTHSPGGEGGGGSIFWRTPNIGLASCSIISLRSTWYTVHRPCHPCPMPIGLPVLYVCMSFCLF